jgi:hypothetical protein
MLSAFLPYLIHETSKRCDRCKRTVNEGEPEIFLDAPLTVRYNTTLLMETAEVGGNGFSEIWRRSCTL